MKALIVGLGPVALATARLLQKNGLEFAFLSRRTPRSEQRKQLLETSGVPFCALSSKPELQHWNGTIQGKVHFLDDSLTEAATHLFLAVPHTAYSEVLQKCEGASFESVVLLSPGLFSGEFVRAQAKGRSVTSLSNFWGAAKFQNDSVVLKAVKKKFYVGGSDSPTIQNVGGIFRAAGLNLATVGSSLEAEFRNITLYVHPVLSLAQLTLRTALGLDPVPKYLYKLFPEGPIERRRMKLYAAFAREVMAVGENFGLSPFNLLAFLHRDNYRAPSCFLEEHEVDSYPTLTTQQQGDLLYARYTGLLVDSQSDPDENGRHFDFSAVPVAKASFENSSLSLPRLLAEDIYHLCLLRGLSKRLRLGCPTMDALYADLATVTSELPYGQHELLHQYVSSAKLTAARLVDTLVTSKKKRAVI